MASTTDAPEVIRVRDASVAVPGRQGAGLTVQGLSFSVHRGETLALLGDDGAALRAVLDVLAGRRAPQTGTVARNPGPRRLWRARFLTAYLRPPQRRWGWLRRPAAAETAMKALRSALARRPHLLLIDWSHPALPADGHAALLAALEQSRNDGSDHRPTLVLATGTFADAAAVADRVAVLAGGRLRQVATPRAVYEQPADPRVAILTGDCNRLPGTVLAVEDDSATVRLDSGQEVEAALPAADTPAAGERCILCVRPERVAVSGTAAAALGPGALPARILTHRFLGDHVRLTMQVDGPHAAIVVAKRHPGAPPHAPARDTPVAVAWQPHDATLFRAPPEPS